MVVVRAGLGDNVDLAAGLGTVFRVIERGAHAIFGDGIRRNLQTDFGFLRLLLNTRRVHAVKGKVVVVAGPAGETNCALVAAAVVSPWGEASEIGPVSAVQREVFDLVLADHDAALGGTPFLGRQLNLHLNLFRRVTDLERDVQCAGLAYLHSYIFNYLGFESLVGDENRVVADGNSGEAIVAV